MAMTISSTNRHNSVNQCVADEWTAAMKRSQANAIRWRNYAQRLAEAIADGDVDRAERLAEEITGCRN